MCFIELGRLLSMERVWLEIEYKNLDVVLDISDHEKNSNQNCSDIPSYTHWDGYYYKQRENSKCWQGCREIGTLCDCSRELPLYKTREVPQKLKIEAPYDLETQHLDIYGIVVNTLCQPE